MKESLRITRHENGFTVRVNSILNDDTETKLTYLFEEQEEDLQVIDLLYFVLEYFGYYYSKHKRYNFQILREGRKEEEEEAVESAWHNNTGEPMEEEYPG